MAFIIGDTVPLNRSEHGYVAIEGLAGTMAQPYLMRFDTPVDEADVRRVLRALVTAYPKLRAALEPGLHRYHLRILPEGPHLLVDGMTMVEQVRQILRGLNGLPVEAMPLEAASMVGSIAPERWWQWPRQMWLSRRHKLEEARRLAGLHVQQLPTHLGAHYSVTGLSHHSMPMPVADLPRAARQLGVSLNTLLVSAIAQTFLNQAPDDPQAAAVIRISVNLRKYYPQSAGHGPQWGNHVGAFLVIEQDARKSWQGRVRSVDAAIKEGQARHARREMCWAYLLEEITPWLGRTLIGHIGLKLNARLRCPLGRGSGPGNAWSAAPGP